ncbi:MAG: hypothetical protein HKN26_07025 [Acidimicrobiales bacterium]|nr:hypothetical protein [Acidimicrobiales bacterium]
MSDQDSIDRRRLLRGGIAFGAATWVAPSVLRLDTVAAATGSGLCYSFEGDAAPWTIDNKAGPDGKGLWQVDDSRSTDGSWSLHYGKGTGNTYRKGNQATSGTVTSPDVTLPASGTMEMSFWIWREVENRGGGGNWDEFTVSVGQTGDILYSRSNDGGTGGVFEYVVLDLSAYAGTTINLVFGFATYDKNFNDFEGIYIDDVQFTPTITTGLIGARQFNRVQPGYFPLHDPVDPSVVEARSIAELEENSRMVQLPAIEDKQPAPPTSPPPTSPPTTLPTANAAVPTPASTTGPPTTSVPAAPSTTAAPPTTGLPGTTGAPPTPR